MQVGGEPHVDQYRVESADRRRQGDMVKQNDVTFFGQGRDDLSSADRSVQDAFLVGPRRDGDLHTFQPLGRFFHPRPLAGNFLLRDLPRPRQPTNVQHRRLGGQPLGQQVIPRVSRGDVHRVTDDAQVLDVFAQ